MYRRQIKGFQCVHTAAKVLKELWRLALKAEDIASFAISCLGTIWFRDVVTRQHRIDVKVAGFGEGLFT